MGRYYSGSIDGKFLFGIQSSYAPKRFGGVEREPELVYFCKAKLPLDTACLVP